MEGGGCVCVCVCVCVGGGNALFDELCAKAFC